MSFEKSDLKTQIGAWPGQHFTRIALTAGTIWPDKGALATIKRAAKDACVRGVVCESEAHIIIPVFLSFEFSKDRFENSIVFFLRFTGGAYTSLKHIP